jgi:superfamily I DNA and/or RNA helicase
MSPLSVSTFLAPNVEFDVVIFDEASQIFPQDAIGAIYRGKQLIVVGDSKQMPPSNFFTATNDNDDEDEDSIADFESILDVCATALPQKRLKWHYRSRYEQLISFSNKHFYDNDLVTFPSSKSDRPGIGIDYVFADGRFDRTTKTNMIEAQMVVDLVFAHFDRYPERSLGVVAFSISQQNLIDKLIKRVVFKK